MRGESDSRKRTRDVELDHVVDLVSQQIADAAKHSMMQMMNSMDQAFLLTPQEVKARTPELMSKACERLDREGVSYQARWVAAAVEGAIDVYVFGYNDYLVNMRRLEKEKEIVSKLIDLYGETAVTGITASYTEAQWERADSLLRQLPPDAAIYRAEDTGDEAFDAARREMVRMLEELRSEHEAARPVVDDIKAARRELERQERIAAHRKPDVVMETRRCSSCGKKPAKVDDLCKRCAYASGVMPHGKIGEA